jgi:hypothetical protein
MCRKKKSLRKWLGRRWRGDKDLGSNACRDRPLTTSGSGGTNFLSSMHQNRRALISSSTPDGLSKRASFHLSTGKRKSRLEPWDP